MTWFWWYMLAVSMMIPVIMIIAGRIMWKRCPQKINWVYGYRTARSMKNADTWRFAHEHCGRLWWRIGWILLLPTALAMLPVYGRGENPISIAGLLIVTVHLIVLIASIFPTERALKQAFNDDGSRKE